MDDENNSTADRLEQALRDLKGHKKAASAIKMTPELKRLTALHKKLEALTQNERRKVLDASGLRHISAAPRPITPLRGSSCYTPPSRPPEVLAMADTKAAQNLMPVPEVAPVVAVGDLAESAKVRPGEDGLLTKEIAVTFDGVNKWDAKRWPKNLSASKWLHPARTALGGAGGASSVWNPLTLAQLIHSKTKGDKEREQIMRVFYSRFNNNPVLMQWRDGFNEYFATHCATD